MQYHISTRTVVLVITLTTMIAFSRHFPPLLSYTHGLQLALTFKCHSVVQPCSFMKGINSYLLFRAGDDRCGPVVGGTKSRCHFMCGRWMGRRKL